MAHGPPPAALAALEAAPHACLVAEGMAAVALRLAVWVAVDAVWEAQAGLPTVDGWQQTHALPPGYTQHDRAAVGAERQTS